MIRFGLQVMVAVAGAGLLGGCSTYASWQEFKKIPTYELGEAGGAPGHYESKFLPAKSAKMVVLREATIFTMLSEMDARNIKSNLDKEYFIRISRKLNRQISAEYVKAATACKTATTALASGCAETVEGDTPVIESDLLSMARFAFEPDKFKKLVKDVETANAFGGIRDASAVMLDVLVDMHEGAATVRSAIHLAQDSRDNKVQPYEAAYKAFDANRDAFAATEIEASAVDAMVNIAWNICNNVARDLPPQSITNLGANVWEDTNSKLEYCVYRSSDGVTFLPPAGKAAEDAPLAVPPAGGAPVVAAAAAAATQ